MARYIDADKISYHLSVGDDAPVEGISVAYKYDVDRVPTADVTEVKHGNWYNASHYQEYAFGQCSVCNKSGRLRVDRDNMGIWYINSPYCPNCGSKMDGKISYL